MSDDIVTRLRGAADRKYGCGCVKCEAAAEIERLRAEIERLRAELRTYTDGSNDDVQREAV
jgi:hypothetical protein